MSRETFLDQVKSLVCRDRNASYGDPRDNFSQTAEVINAVLGLSLSGRDVGIIMCCVKLARLRTSPEALDTYLDLAGYAACTADFLPPRELSAEEAGLPTNTKYTFHLEGKRHVIWAANIEEAATEFQRIRPDVRGPVRWESPSVPLSDDRYYTFPI